MNEGTGFSFKFKLFGLSEALKETEDFNKTLKEMKDNLEDFDSKLEPIGKKIEKAFKLEKNSIAEPLKEFEKTFVTLRKDGVGTFTAIGISVKETLNTIGGLGKALKLVSSIALGGVLLFLGTEAFKNNIGGIATMFSRLSGELSMLFANLRIATREVMKELEPFIKFFVDMTSTFLLDFLKGLNFILKSLIEAPPIIKMVTGAIIGLGIALWALNTHPIIATVTILLGALIALYNALKWIVNLFRDNNNLSMNVNTNFSGKGYNWGGVVGGGSTSNVDNTRLITNNVYVTGTGYGRQDGRNIAEELSYMGSIRKTM